MNAPNRDEYVKLFHNVCRRVLTHCPNPYAQAYAQAGLGLTTNDEIYTQALYIMANTDGWRHGVEAKLANAALKNIIAYFGDMTRH